ncbi:hydrolase of the HAD superfamily [Strigomonas culicis]|uniref:Hydrolase of the HAD superfamily n=1 Tax=Strigomonas culicis TaxID=28005 RepID=S9U8E9_9TRYP|nr:hydrolase of the HAD superfamily [Strigomonas culicis]|eukprot:EPY25153.1 hydrolase of the HAD superfamily [Strigomonas culicis]
MTFSEPSCSYILLLDIDNTLYRYDATGFGAAMHNNIYAFIMQHYHLTVEEAGEFATRYYHNYGVSLLGFFIHFRQMNAKAYSDYVHNTLDYAHRVAPDVPLRAMLARMAGKGTDDAAATRKNRYDLYYFTNANRRHAIQCLRHLDLLSLFVPAAPIADRAWKEYDVTYAELQKVYQHHPPAPSGADHPRREDRTGIEEVSIKAKIASPSAADEGGEAAAEAILDELYKSDFDGYSYEDQWRLTEPHLENKPYRAAYEAVAADIQRRQQQQGLAEEGQAVVPCNYIMVDDSLMNLKEPLHLGWRAVWITDAPTAHQPEKKSLFAEDEREFYETAIKENRLKVIHSILELESACAEF